MYERNELQALPSLRKYFPDALEASSSAQWGSSGRHLAPAPAAEDSDDEEKEASRLQEELKKVKRERTALLQALTAARTSTAGQQPADLASRDIQALRASLAEKQEALNELRERNAELEQS